MQNFSIDNWLQLAGVLITLYIVLSSNKKTRQHNEEQTAIQKALLSEWQIQREAIDIEQNKKLIEIETSVNTLSKVQSEQAYDITLLQRENSVTVELLKKIEHSLDELKSLPAELKFIKELFEEKLNNVKRPYTRTLK